NTDNTPQLKLVKTVTNNDGGTKVANDFTLAAAAASPKDRQNSHNHSSHDQISNVFSAAKKTLTENPNPGTGYSTTGIWSCDCVTFDTPNTNTYHLSLHVALPIFNTDNTPQLKLVKTVTNNDGGTKVANDFTLAAAAASP